MRYENPFYWPEDAGAAAPHRGLKRLQPASAEIARAGDRWMAIFRFQAARRETDADMTASCGGVSSPLARRRLRPAESETHVCKSARAARPEPTSDGCATGSGGCRLERHGDLGRKARMNLQSSTSRTTKPASFPSAAGADHAPTAPPGRRQRHARAPRARSARSIFALVDDRDRLIRRQWATVTIRSDSRREHARIFGRSYAAEPDARSTAQEDEAIAEADTLLLTVPNQLGVAYNAHVLEAILTIARGAMGMALTCAHLCPDAMRHLCRSQIRNRSKQRVETVPVPRRTTCVRTRCGILHAARRSGDRFSKLARERSRFCGAPPCPGRDAALLLCAFADPGSCPTPHGVNGSGSALHHYRGCAAPGTQGS